jgi:hypothetical protein
MTEKIRDAAEQADLIVNGYAFRKKEDKLFVLNLNNPEKALVLGANDEVLETSMDDIEIQVVMSYLERNRKFMEN